MTIDLKFNGSTKLPSTINSEKSADLAPLKPKLNPVYRLGAYIKEQRAIADYLGEVTDHALRRSAETQILAIDQQATLVKTQMSASMVPAMASIGRNLLETAQDAALEIRQADLSGKNASLDLRHAALKDLDQRLAQGKITPTEHKNLASYTEDATSADMHASAEAARRLMATLDHHVARATDHITNEINRK